MKKPNYDSMMQKLDVCPSPVGEKVEQEGRAVVLDEGVVEPVGKTDVVDSVPVRRSIKRSVGRPKKVESVPSQDDGWTRTTLRTSLIRDVQSLCSYIQLHDGKKVSHSAILSEALQYYAQRKYSGFYEEFLKRNNF